jgi:hypothetical protein
MPYKIRDGEGLYSTGGNSPFFTKQGKTWIGLGALKCHITQWRDRGYGQASGAHSGGLGLSRSMASFARSRPLRSSRASRNSSLPAERQGRPKGANTETLDERKPPLLPLPCRRGFLRLCGGDSRLTSPLPYGSIRAPDHDTEAGGAAEKPWSRCVAVTALPKTCGPVFPRLAVRGSWAWTQQ